MRVRLTRKLAECIDGVDLTGRVVGDVLEVSDRDARCLMAEGWAVPADTTVDVMSLATSSGSVGTRPDEPNASTPPQGFDCDVITTDTPSNANHALVQRTRKEKSQRSSEQSSPVRD
jgi:hypothetical protein